MCVCVNVFLFYFSFSFLFFWWYCRDLELGDVVIVGQCRPLSKTVRFNVLKVQKGKKAGAKQFQKF